MSAGITKGDLDLPGALPAVRSCLLVAALLALAGCSGGGGGTAGPDEPEGAPALKATATTGVLRGIVVDGAVRPLADATVNVTGPAGSLAATTDDGGFFGFAGLAPGTYFVEASRLAHDTVRQSAEVVAGVDDPPLVRIQLTFLPSAAPFVLQVQHTGFAQCIVPGANVCFIANFYPCFLLRQAGQPCPGNLTSDQSVFHLVDPILEQGRTPDWTQIEMVWDSTQTVTDWLSFRISPYAWEDGAGVDGRAKGARGKSPVVFSLNRTAAEGWDLGAEVDDGDEDNEGPAKGLALETFAAGNDVTCTGPQMAVINTCSSIGLVLNQQIEYYFHFTYGFVPPEGWQFSVDGPPQPPR